MVSALAPGNWADTWIVGKSTFGSGATGKFGYATKPTKRNPTITSVVAMGYRMKGADRPPLMRSTLALAEFSPPRHARLHP